MRRTRRGGRDGARHSRGGRRRVRSDARHDCGPRGVGCGVLGPRRRRGGGEAGQGLLGPLDHRRSYRQTDRGGRRGDGRAVPRGARVRRLARRRRGRVALRLRRRRDPVQRGDRAGRVVRRDGREALAGRADGRRARARQAHVADHDGHVHRRVGRDARGGREGRPRSGAGHGHAGQLGHGQSHHESKGQAHDRRRLCPELPGLPATKGPAPRAAARGRPGTPGAHHRRGQRAIHQGAPEGPRELRFCRGASGLRRVT
mmetsp:Transcript_22733/g.70301  ORF Transcript_22733/g.70301 Transcript_22733/m.70301 type:complete len:258 (+) Transcript_22733:302-1075(+)